MFGTMESGEVDFALLSSCSSKTCSKAKTQDVLLNEDKD